MSGSVAASLAGRRILVVEDRYLIASEIADELCRLGAEVVGPSSTVARARELVQSESLDLAVLDVNLDGETVFPVAELLAGLGVPLIFLTGYDPEVLPEAWRRRPRLAKPIAARQLREELEKALRPGEGSGRLRPRAAFARPGRRP